MLTTSSTGQVGYFSLNTPNTEILFVVAVKFLEAWDIMATNGYSSLSAGPEAGWLGFYSLDKQGRMDGVSLDSLIAENADSGLVWTDPEVS